MLFKKFIYGLILALSCNCYASDKSIVRKSNTHKPDKFLLSKASRNGLKKFIADITRKNDVEPSDSYSEVLKANRNYIINNYLNKKFKKNLLKTDAKADKTFVVAITSFYKNNSKKVKNLVILINLIPNIMVDVNNLYALLPILSEKDIKYMESFSVLCKSVNGKWAGHSRILAITELLDVLESKHHGNL